MAITLRWPKAELEYKQFISNFMATGAFHNSWAGNDRRPECSKPVEIPRNDVVQVFLKKHPEFVVFREMLLAVRNESKNFLFDEAKWRNLFANSF